MNIRKSLFVILLIFSLTFSSIPIVTAANNIEFKDLKSDNWAYQSVTDMTYRGIISGYEDGTFRPQDSITREEFASLITKTFSLNTTVTKEVYFTDVPPDRWSFKDINASRDYLTGYYPTGGKAFFDPEAKATREDIAYALIKAMGLTKNEKPNSNSHFTDENQISVSLRDYVEIAAEKGLINGYQDGTFRPSNPITRAEVAALLYRAIKNPIQEKSSTPTSNTQDTPAQRIEQTDINIFSSPELTIDLQNKSNIMYLNPQQIMVEFYTKDKNDNLPSLYVNGQKRVYNVRSNYNDGTNRCYFNLDLAQNGANDFTFKLINKYGKESNTVTQSVYHEK